MDFDDLLLHPLELFRTHPDRLAYWQRRFVHVLVDEFQDTNAAQYHLVRHLASLHRNLTVVGDDDQAIYGWRGADVRHMLAFQSDVPGSILVKLEQNYRSTQVILDAANGVIAENEGRPGPRRSSRSSRGAPRSCCSPPRTSGMKPSGWRGNTPSSRVTTTRSYESMAVLYRTNAQSRPLEEAFRFRGIPYRLVGAVSFYERREVKDLLAYLRLIANPSDDEAFLRVINVPRRGIGDASVLALAQAATKWSKPLLEVARVADRVEGLRPNVRDGFARFAATLADLRTTVGNEDPAFAFDRIIDAVHYDAYLADEGAEGVERMENVRELSAGAAAWAEVSGLDGGGGGGGGELALTAGTPIERYLTQSALLAQTDSVQGETGVTLLTVHMAKGLEWPVVALAGLEDGLFPLARSAAQPGGVRRREPRALLRGTDARPRTTVSSLGRVPASARGGWRCPSPRGSSKPFRRR